MTVLDKFRTDTHLDQIYRGRLEYERVRAAEIGELEDTRKERDAAVAARDSERAEKERERAEKERERTEKERLAARLRALGVDPDAE